MAHPDVSPGKLKGRGAKARKTRVIKRETYSRRDFKGRFSEYNKIIKINCAYLYYNNCHSSTQYYLAHMSYELMVVYFRIQKWRRNLRHYN